MKLFVGSLPFAVDDSTLKEAFSEFGAVSSSRVITDKMTGRSRGFGFVEMPDDVSAEKAMGELNGSQIDGRSIVVKKAMERNSGNGDGYGGRRKNQDNRGWGY